MESARVTRVLIVANRTASTPRLIEAVRSRAKAGPCEFALLIPDVANRKEADWTLETAQRSLRPAAQGNVEGLVGGPDPFESVKAAVRDGDFDEIIISTLSKKTPKWLRRDLIRRVETLGLPPSIRQISRKICAHSTARGRAAVVRWLNANSRRQRMKTADYGRSGPRAL
jgi:hypothetical protein